MITEVQANKFFNEDYNKAVQGVKDNCQKREIDYSKLTKPTLAVLIDMTFNMGQLGVYKFTKMWEAL